jgi:hypothetical protein
MKTITDIDKVAVYICLFILYRLRIKRTLVGKSIAIYNHAFPLVDKKSNVKTGGKKRALV